MAFTRSLDQICDDEILRFPGREARRTHFHCDLCPVMHAVQGCLRKHLPIRDSSAPKRLRVTQLIVVAGIKERFKFCVRILNATGAGLSARNSSASPLALVQANDWQRIPLLGRYAQQGCELYLSRGSFVLGEISKPPIRQVVGVREQFSERNCGFWWTHRVRFSL